MTDLSLSGSCLCGSVQFTVSGRAAGFLHCHCGRCRKASGTGHASNILVKPGSVEWMAGEELIGRFDAPDAERFHTRFCRQCGSPLPKLHESLELVVLPAGSLDEDPPINPKARIFWGSRSAWSCGDGDLKQYDEYPTRG